MPYIPNPAAITRLNQGVVRGFKASALAMAQDATEHDPTRGRGPVRVVRLSNDRAIVKGSGLAPVYEGGRVGGYPIVPGGVASGRRSYSRKRGVTFRIRKLRGSSTRALRFTRGDGGFAAYAVGGDMRARPYIGPAAVRWAKGGAQAAMRASLAASGFGGLRR